MAATLSAAAASLVTWPARAQGAPLWQASEAETQQAAKAYAQGLKAMKRKRYEQALAAFQESYDTVRSPNSQLMMGRALVELGQLGRGWDAFQTAKREAAEAAHHDAKYEQTKEAAAAELLDLQKRAGFIVVHVHGAGRKDRVLVEGEGRERALAELGEPIAAAPGSLRVALVTSSGGTRIERTVDVRVGGTVEVDLSPPQPPRVEKPESELAETTTPADTTRTLGYVAAGIGVGGLVTFGIFGALNESAWSEVEDACDGRVCPPSAEDDASAGQTYQTVANIGLLVGVVGVASGVTLLLLPGDERNEKSAKGTRLRVGPTTVSLSGRF